jgi:hypothetical protein
MSDDNIVKDDLWTSELHILIELSIFADRYDNSVMYLNSDTDRANTFLGSGGSCHIA